MSVRVDIPSRKDYSNDSIIKWADDDDDVDNDNNGVDDVKESISSEEESGSDYDVEQRARNRSSHDIWDQEIILSKLQTLPDGQTITDLLLNHNVKQLLNKNQSTALLIASWLGKDEIVKILLENGAPIEAKDENGRTPLHLAAIAGNFETMKLLLNHKANIEAKDSVHNITPLHCAASKGNLSCLRLLIKNGADVNAGLSVKSPLLYAVENLAVDCVKELLENNATPNTPQIFSETPLHAASANGSIEIIKLLLKYGAAVNVKCGQEKLTPLHLAAEDGDAECVRLLLDAGASLTAKNHKKQTPLHLAALSQSCDNVELLLTRGADPNASDCDGRTPLHCAIVKVSRSCECVRLLINYGANVNRADNFGYTPLHLAALNEFSNCVLLLLNNGGDATAKTNGGISVLAFITRKTPEVIPKYIEKFDSSIKLTDHEIGDVDCELKIDFRILVPMMGQKETDLLLNFIEVGKKDILKHPLCETFLFLKWRRIRKFFLFSLFYHLLFVILYSFYVIGVYLKDCPSLRRKTIIARCQTSKDIQIFGYILIIFNIILLLKEFFQIFHSWKIYIKQRENWLQCTIIISVFCCVQPINNSMNIKYNVDDWQHHVAAIGIFLAWVELMLIVGRFPIFGLYIQMFTTVSYNFTKFIAAYFCLLLAFALSFGVLFANYKSFNDLKWVILKIIVMMSGELEYEDIFFDNDAPIIYKTTAQIMFLAFVILVTVILTNLMVGLAVSDIQGLQQSAGLDRLVRQCELVAHLESMLFSKLLTCLPHKLMNFFHQQALLLKSQYHWALYIKPNDPREERIPKDLIKSIYKLVVSKKERPKSKKGRFLLRSPPLSRHDSYSSNNEINIRIQINNLKKDLQEFNRNFTQKLDFLMQQR